MNSNSNSNWQLWLVTAIALVSRLPFLGAGYGVEEDSWGIAVAMHNTVETGVIEASRLPGHPVHELFLVLVWSLGGRFFAFNLVSAVAGAIGVLFFGLILKRLGFKHYALAALAFAFVPVIFIAGTYTIDYAWTITFVLASYYTLLDRRLWLTGILLGLAIGCRITTAAMLLPFAIHLWNNDSFKDWFMRVFRVSIAAAIVGILCYVPVVAVYGSGFFTYSDQFPYPPWSKIFYKGTIGVFGLIGLAAIILFTIYILLSRKRKKDALYAQPLHDKISWSWFSVIILYIIAYFGLPQKSAYLIPLVPFVLLMFTRHLSTRMFRIFSICIIASSFFFSINLTDPFRGSRYSPLAFTTTVSGQELFFDPLTGPVWSDYTKRKQKMSFTRAIRENAKTLPSKSVIISGWWYNMILTELYDEPGPQSVVYTFYTDEQTLRNYVSQGYDIYYLPEQNKYNDLNFSMQVTDQLAKPFITQQ